MEECQSIAGRYGSRGEGVYCCAVSTGFETKSAKLYVVLEE